MDKKYFNALVFASLVEAELPVDQKVKIMKESTDIQKKAFILDGYIPELDEQASQIVEKRFKVAIKEGYFAYGNWIALAHQHAHEKRQYFMKTKCHKVDGDQAKVCKAQADMFMWDEYMAFLKRGESRCSKTDNEAKCKERFNRAASYFKIQKAKAAERLARFHREKGGAKVKVF